MMQRLPLSFTQAQWVTTVYNLIFAALLITTGRLGDRVVRRTILGAGLAVFGLGSLLAGVAPNAAALIAARAAQGLGGAMVLPSTLSTVNATFRGRERAAAFGIWGATIAGSAAVGPLAGGWLTDTFSWRWIFGINLPLIALICLGAWLWVPQTREDSNRTTHSGFDLPGLLLSALGMGGVVFGLIEGRSLGWWKPLAGHWSSAWPISPATLGLGLGILLLTGFVVVELRRAAANREVMLDLNLLRLHSFAWGNLAAMTVAIGEFGLLFVLPLYLQNVRSLSPVGAGWVLAAMAAGAFLSGAVAAPLSQATTAATVATTGLILETLGVGVLALLLRADTPIWQVVVPLVIYGTGLGLASAQLTSTILIDVPPSQSGQGSAAQSTVRQLGSALGVAVIATVMAASVNSAASGTLAQPLAGQHVPAQVSTALEDSLAPSAGSVIAALEQGSGTAAQLPAPAREIAAQVLAKDFAAGARVPMFLGAGFLALGVLAASRLPRHKVIHRA
ncbi:Antiseptic resistance protein [Actinomyces bovis]|uniref:Antiseptic resistance protein n=2 Tax=Actinomyces bovis TaxID=1658 RepID=A0ABY1VST0_9ACTO|nr:Antiseptic resistance protein [Actinomyces bovis]VEG55914.1 Antiseptic resistance protein [Actinomyces israelii]